jgi:hypothetical protein
MRLISSSVRPFAGNTGRRARSSPIVDFACAREYEGFVCLEYRPLVDTATSLEWMKAEASPPR